MSRHFFALTILALAGTALVLPEASARSSFSGGGRVGGFAAPFAAPHHARLGPSRRVPGAYGAILQRPFVAPASRPAAHAIAHGFGRNIAPDLRARFVRRHHRGSIAGYVYPFTSEGYGDAPYLGTPYDPAEAIPVYAPPQVYPVPAEIDNEIARLKLATMGAEIDQLTEEQAKYLASWDEGT